MARPSRRRLTAEERRAQLLRAASDLLGRSGASAVQMTSVAAEAGVTRPVVYRHFGSRRELLLALLEDFEAQLATRFVEAAPLIEEGAAASLIARWFVDVVCDTIEDRGVGPWNLLSARWVDPEIAEEGAGIMDRLVSPWLQQLDGMGDDPLVLRAVGRMVVATGRAALDAWVDGVVSREDAASLAARGVSSLLSGFGAAELPGQRRT